MSTFRCLLCSWIVIGFLGFPGGVPAHQERLILAMTKGNCVLRVEADDQSHTLRLRLLPEGPTCQVTQAAMHTILKAVFAQTDPPKLAGPYTSLFLGRLMEYPWLSAYLATSAYHDRQWDRKLGKPVTMGLYRYVRSILSRKEVTAQFDEPFGDSGYRVVAVTVEKVGVGGFADIPLYAGPRRPGKVPCDALVWLTLEKKEPGSGPEGYRKNNQ